MLNKNEFLNRAVNICRLILGSKIKEGDVVVDATVGNGHDTLFLAKSVGLSGKVYGFDVQKLAIDKTSDLLDSNGFGSNVTLIHDGHENIDKYIKETVKAVLFNLGYLPGADKNISTKSSTTITAIEKAMPLLDAGGVILIAIYYGEPTGTDELEALLEFSSKIDQQKYNVFYLNFINQANNPPSLLSIEKRI